MSQAIVLASSVKRFVPVDVYVIGGRDGSEYGRSRDFDAACARMRNVVETLSDYSVSVVTTRELRFE